MNRTRALRALRRSPLLILFALLAAAGCQGGHQAEKAAGAPVSVRAVAVQASPVSDIVEAAGSLHGASDAVLAAKVMGTVIEIRKTAGQSVRRGEVLIVLDDREVAGNIGQAEGALAQAKAASALAASNLQRFEHLKERGAASQLELDQARFAHETALGAVRQAEAAVATASSYRNYARIPAPFDGQVVDRMVEIGDLAAPGRPLMRVEDASRLTLHVSLSETQAHAAQTGGQVEVSVPSLAGRTWTGTVAEVVPAVDTAGFTAWRRHTFTLKAHPQEIAENGVDTGHLVVVHGYRALTELAPLALDGPLLRARYGFERPRQSFGQASIRSAIDIHQWGLGYALVEVDVLSVGLRTRQLVLATPTGDDALELRIGMAVHAIDNPGALHWALTGFPAKRWLTDRVADRAMGEYIADVSQDVDIWETKRWIARPALAEGDGPIGKYRRWARQFYAAPAG